MPTIVVNAPRIRAISATLRSVRGPEGVQDVQRGDVDDDAARTMAADLANQVPLEPNHLGVIERGMDRRNQVGALSQDGDQRRSGAH